MPSEDSAEGGKRFGLYLGRVVENADPAKIGRCRIEIPGLIAKTGWALPVSGGGGSALALARYGVWAPFKLGATVVVGFLQGDVDSPVFWSANFGIVDGASQVPGPVGGYARVNRDDGSPGKPEEISPEDATQISAIETKNFVVIIDDRPGKERLVLEAKGTGDRVSIGLDTIEIKALGAMLIQCDGTLNINAGQLNLNGRGVLISTKPIG